MKDREILDEVYSRLVEGRNEYSQGLVVADKLIDFIEQEWQKQDDKEVNLSMKMLSENPSKKWYTDVRDMERHRKLTIGEDGTVKELE